MQPNHKNNFELSIVNFCNLVRCVLKGSSQVFSLNFKVVIEEFTLQKFEFSKLSCTVKLTSRLSVLIQCKRSVGGKVNGLYQSDRGTYVWRLTHPLRSLLLAPWILLIVAKRIVNKYSWTYYTLTVNLFELYQRDFKTV